MSLPLTPVANQETSRLFDSRTHLYNPLAKQANLWMKPAHFQEGFRVWLFTLNGGLSVWGGRSEKKMSRCCPPLVLESMAGPTGKRNGDYLTLWAALAVSVPGTLSPDVLRDLRICLSGTCHRANTETIAEVVISLMSSQGDSLSM